MATVFFTTQEKKSLNQSYFTCAQGTPKVEDLPCISRLVPEEEIIFMLKETYETKGRLKNIGFTNSAAWGNNNWKRQALSAIHRPRA